jgi:opacity protein-like surface antigen
VIALNSAILSAQEFGIRAGVDLVTAKAKFEGISVSDNETGFYIGLFTKFEVSEKFGFRPEVNFISVSDLEQIQIPLLAQIGLLDALDVVVGPSFGFLLDVEEGIKSLNFGADLGLVYNLKESFLIEARYNLGISDLAEDNEFDATLKLSGFQIGVGYKF